MNAKSMANDIFADNFANERKEREVEKYGPRLPMAQMAAHAHVYERHSIEPAYGQFSEPSQEIV